MFIGILTDFPNGRPKGSPSKANQRALAGTLPSKSPGSPIRLGHGLDPLGHLRRRHSPQPDALRLSLHSHYRILFWRTQRPRTGASAPSWVFVYRRVILNQFHPGSGGGLNRRSYGGHAPEPGGPDRGGGHSGLFRHQSFGLLGTAST